MAVIDKHIFDQLLPPSSKTLGFAWLGKRGWPISTCSESALRKLGLDLADIEAGQVKYQSLIHPDDLPRVLKAIEKNLAGFRPASDSEDATIEYRLRTKENDWIWVESEKDMSIFGEEGDMVVLGFLQDVTAKREAEIALKKNQDRLELILEGTDLGMWDWNPQTNEVTCDKRWAEQIGLTLEELNMKLTDWSSRVHPDDLDGCLHAIQAHLDQKTPLYENVHRLRHADGHWVHILDRGKVFERDEQGRATKFIGTHTDVSHLKKVELEAIAALHARDRFFSSMSHELRTPLHAILGTVELLENELTDDSQRAKVNLVKESGEYLLNVLKDILDVAKMEEGELTLHVSAFNLSDLVAQVAELFSSRATQKGLLLETTLPDALDSGLQTDRTRALQVLVNLVSNAVKYTQSGGVMLTLSEQDEDLLVTITDTGPGILDLDDVFRPFRQGEHVAIDDVHTTGLGLPIVKQLVDLMGIELTVNSVAQKGTEFQLRFPAVIRRSGITVAVETPIESTPINWSSLRVLLVDDNQVNLTVASAMLNSRQVQVTVASDGNEAIEQINKSRFDVVCMDLHMPNLGGLSATRQIRQLDISPQPRIIGVSADAYDDTIDQCLAAGMDAYLTKPFRRRDLFEAIYNVLSADNTKAQKKEP